MNTIKTAAALTAAAMLVSGASAREYMASTGRYVQADPIGWAGGPNPFGYSNGNPLTYVDPDGRIPIILIPVVTAALGGAAGGGGNYLVQRHWQKKCDIDWFDVGNAAAWGALGGAALPASGSSVLGAAAVGATANLGQYFTGSVRSGHAPTGAGIAWSAAAGATGGGIGGTFARPITYGAVGTALPHMARDAQTMATMSANATTGSLSRNGIGGFTGNAPPEAPDLSCTCRRN